MPTIGVPHKPAATSTLPSCHESKPDDARWKLAVILLATLSAVFATSLLCSPARSNPPPSLPGIHHPGPPSSEEVLAGQRR
jgi:hypothetical protein